MATSPCDGVPDGGIDGDVDGGAGDSRMPPDVAIEDTASSGGDSAGVDASMGPAKTGSVSLEGSGGDVGGLRGAGGGGGIAGSAAFALAMLLRRRRLDESGRRTGVGGAPRE